jgi:hypothetical protein
MRIESFALVSIGAAEVHSRSYEQNSDCNGLPKPEGIHS